MTEGFAVGVSGMALLAVAVWRFEGRAPRAAFAIALSLCGIGLIAMAAVQAGSGWMPRLGIIGVCSAAAGSAGGMLAAVPGKGRAGAVLARLGTGGPAASSIVPALVLWGGMIGVAMQFVDLMTDGHRPGAALILTGQALFFLTFSTWLRLKGKTG
jgi:hypothetical protein